MRLPEIALSKPFRIGLRVLSLAIVWHTLMFFGIPLPALAAIFVVLLTVLLLARFENALLLTATLVVATLALELALRATGLGSAQRFVRAAESPEKDCLRRLVPHVES